MNSEKQKLDVEKKVRNAVRGIQIAKLAAVLAVTLTLAVFGYSYEPISSHGRNYKTEPLQDGAVLSVAARAPTLIREIILTAALLAGLYCFFAIGWYLYVQLRYWREISEYKTKTRQAEAAEKVILAEKIRQGERGPLLQHAQKLIQTVDHGTHSLWQNKLVKVLVILAVIGFTIMALLTLKKTMPNCDFLKLVCTG